MNFEENKQDDITPYRAKSNLNILIGNPDANINDAMEVNIKSVNTNIKKNISQDNIETNNIMTNNIVNNNIENKVSINNELPEQNKKELPPSAVNNKVYVTTDNKPKKKKINLNLTKEFKIALLIIVILFVFILILDLLPSLF